MEQAGRLVFPIFAMVLGVGLRGEGGSARAWRMLRPLALIAFVAHVAAMPLVDAGVRGDAWNVLATLCAGALAVAAMGEGTASRIAFVSVAALVAWFSEYGWIGAGLVLATWAGSVWAVWLLLALLSVLQLTVMPLLVPGMFWLVHWMCGDEAWRSPRRLFAWGYVGQFAVFSALVMIGARA